MKEKVLKKIGVLKVKNGTYIKDGKEKNRYNDIGIVFASPHHSRLSIKFHNTATGEGQWADVFYDEGLSPDTKSAADTGAAVDAEF